MPAIIGKKLGMSQVFTEDGTLVPVTVVEAGPCVVTAVRSADKDGYDAIQLAFGEIAERKLSKGELGHLKKAGAPPSRTRRRVPRPRPRDADRRRGQGQRLRGRLQGQGFRDGDRQGLPGHDQAPQLQPRPGQPRLAQRSRPRFGRRQRRPRPRLQGHEDARPDGRQAQSPSAASRSSAWTRTKTCC